MSLKFVLYGTRQSWEMILAACRLFPLLTCLVLIAEAREVLPASVPVWRLPILGSDYSPSSVGSFAVSDSASPDAEPDDHLSVYPIPKEGAAGSELTVVLQIFWPENFPLERNCSSLGESVYLSRDPCVETLPTASTTTISLSTCIGPSKDGHHLYFRLTRPDWSLSTNNYLSGFLCANSHSLSQVVYYDPVKVAGSALGDNERVTLSAVGHLVNNGWTTKIGDFSCSGCENSHVVATIKAVPWTLLPRNATTAALSNPCSGFMYDDYMRVPQATDPSATDPTHANNDPTHANNDPNHVNTDFTHPPIYGHLSHVGADTLGGLNNLDLWTHYYDAVDANQMVYLSSYSFAACVYENQHVQNGTLMSWIVFTPDSTDGACVAVSILGICFYPIICIVAFIMFSSRMKAIRWKTESISRVVQRLQLTYELGSRLEIPRPTE